MAGEVSGNDWTSIFLGLPPTIQGVVATLGTLMVGYFAYQKFMRRLRGDEPSSTDLMVGDPTTFTDMTSVKKLAAAVEQLTLQMMKSAVSSDGVAAQVASSAVSNMEVAKSLTHLCDLVGQLLIDMREQREEQELEDAWQRGHDEGARQRTPRRRPQPKKPPGRTG